MNSQDFIDTIANVAEVFPKVYDDGLSPSVKTSGQTLNLIPRAVNAALAPLEKWILNKEYSIEETKILLEEKLKSRNSNNIVPPEPYIAVPALQSISYCMDSTELRNLYANLLANSMDSSQKDRVHPTFVEIIKQLSPFDANLLHKLSLIRHDAIPICKFRLEASKSNPEGVDICKHILDPNLGISYENYKKYAISIDNLERLSLIAVDYSRHYTKDSLYDSIKNSQLANMFKGKYSTHNTFKRFKVSCGCLDVTDLGNEFINICLG